MATDTPAGAALSALHRLARRLPKPARSALRFNLSVLVGEMVKLSDAYASIQLRNIALLEELNETARVRHRTRQLLRYRNYGSDCDGRNG